MKKSNRLALAFFIAILVLSVLFAHRFGLLSVQPSYSTAYEGAKACFHGIYDWELGGTVYTNAEHHGASLCRFDTTMQFDRDGATVNAPNLVGEMTSVMVPVSSGWVPPNWVPSEWWRDAASWRNPVQVYPWKVKNPDGTFTVYRMEEWKLKWFISLSAEYDSGPDPFNLYDEAQNQRYHNLEVWFEFDVQPVWYFEGQQQAYFAIAKIELTNVKTEGNPRFTPMSPGSILTIYLNPFDKTEKAAGEEEFKAFYYQNRTLNPQYFRDKVYAYIVLNDFGTNEWWEWTHLQADGDVITLGFTVTVFVVGEWKVQDVQDIDDYEGRDSKLRSWGWTGLSDFVEWLSNGWNSLMEWLGNPFNLAGLGLFGLLAIAIVVAVVMFWFFGAPKR